MLMPFEVKINNRVSVTDDNSKRYKQSGKITFIENKLGFRAGYEYQEITVKFDDSLEELFKSWFLKLNEN